MMTDHTPTSQQSFLALGDSYTIGESVDPQERWPVLLVKELNKKGHHFGDPVIIATTGWRTDQLLAAIEKLPSGQTYDLVSLLIGVNNQYQGKPVESYAPEFRKLLQVAIEKAGGRKERVFVVSIPDYGFTPFGKDKQEKISPEIDAYNQVNKEISESEGILYIDITGISREGLDNPALVASDGLHPSGKMYSAWVARILSQLTIR